MTVNNHARLHCTAIVSFLVRLRTASAMAVLATRVQSSENLPSVISFTRLDRRGKILIINLLHKHDFQFFISFRNKCADRSKELN